MRRCPTRVSIRSNATSAARAEITSDLLDVSKALTGELRVDCQIVPLDNCAREAAQSARPAAHAKGVHIVAHLSETPVVVLADPNRLRQIIWHLLANAIKFTPRGGRVELTVGAGHDPGAPDRA